MPLPGLIAPIGGEITPDFTLGPVDWADIATANGTSNTNAAQVMSEINQPIALQMTYTGTNVVNVLITPFVNGVQPPFTNIIMNNGSTAVFGVLPGDSVHFRLSSSSSATGSGTVTITNFSTGGTAVDTFTVTVT